ncbi:hypothetical protein AAG570_011933 [Ranatra chinensis]|uniref:Neural Wiskott-Aldrich syndrome protein n=1 Tax=Ranatra chinensis TaxID=642074 RepID=A0ABD0YTR9_9HEMI
MQTLATTVIELYTTGGLYSGEWRLRDTGVLCLVKDNTRRSYFFRLFCPVRRTLLWEHEVYNNMQYLAPTTFLHTFEAEDCITGFNFANEYEGAMLREVLLEKLESKKQRRMDMGGTPNGTVVTGTGGGGGAVTTSSYQFHHRPATGSSSLIGKHRGVTATLSSSSSSAKKRLTKADIGKPHNFRHVSHVGWTPDRGFDLDNVEDPQLKEFFAKAGVSETQLQDRETREFIYDFILRNGGMEAVKGELQPAPVPVRGKAPPPPPSRTPPTLPPPPPPPPPLRTLPPRNPPTGEFKIVY